MLQLLLQRGQSYEDIASLLGLGVDDVRARARAALTEIAGEDPDREVGLTDYLLGQADPIGRADAARHLQADSDANALAGKLEAQLRLLAPGAQLPDLPRAQAPRPARKAAAGQERPAAKIPAAPGSLSGRQRRVIAGLLAGVAVLIAVALVVGGAFDGGGGGSGSSTTGEGSTSTTAANGDQVTKAVLRPLDGGSGRGVALFAQVRRVPVIQVTTIGLDQLSKGDTYYVWLYKSDKLALRVGGFVVDNRGRAVTQLQVPAEAVALVANGTFKQIDVTLTADADYRAALAAARRSKTLPALTGTSVMRGDITGPLVGAANRATGPTGATGQEGG